MELVPAAGAEVSCVIVLDENGKRTVLAVFRPVREGMETMIGFTPIAGKFTGIVIT